MSVKNIVQIGLDRSAEYIHLADDKMTADDTKHPERPVRESLPDAFNDGSFHFYGIDMCPGSITHLSEKYKETERSTWICGRVGAKNGKLARTPLNFKDASIRNICVPTFTLAQMIEDLKLETLDLLAVDIEGDEYVLFEKHDWKIKPFYIKIEGHIGHKAPEKACPEHLIQSICGHNYEIANLTWATKHILNEEGRKFFIDFIRRDA